MKNSGVIVGKQETDFIAGTPTGLPYEALNPSGDWRPYLPSGETQRTLWAGVDGQGVIDVMACVTFSALNSLEMQYKLLTGREINFSDRFTATKSGTTPQGNYLYKVADSLRHDGIVEEIYWPNIKTDKWDVYYSPIPEDVTKRGLDSLNQYEISYEWISPITPENLKFHLKHAPLQIVILGGRHAVVDIHCEEDINHYFDSYVPYVKQTTEVTWPFKIVLKLKPMLKLVILKGTKEQFIRGIDGKDRHVYNTDSLKDLFNAGVTSLIPEEVDSVNPSGTEWVSLLEE